MTDNKTDLPKLPPGSSKWWNLPMKKLTPEQQEIKRKYARQLYHKNKNEKPTVESLQQENLLLKNIIKYYKITLENNFDNNNMEEKSVPTKIATFAKYKKYAEKPYLFVNGGEYAAMMALAASGVEGVRFNKIYDVCKCSQPFNIQSVEYTDKSQCILNILVPQFADAITGLSTPGPIEKVELLCDVDGVHKTIEYGRVENLQNWKFPTAIPQTKFIKLGMRITFTDVLKMSKIAENAEKKVPLLSMEYCFFHFPIREKLGLSIAVGENSAPADEYFCNLFNL